MGERLFGLTVRVPRALRHAIRLYCFEADITIQRFMREAVVERMQRFNSTKIDNVARQDTRHGPRMSPSRGGRRRGRAAPASRQ